MNSKEFAYWLQGWFELSNEIDHGLSLTEKSNILNIIKKHIDLVYEVEHGKVSSFINWFEGYIADREHKDIHFLTIRGRLSQEFQHVIDSSYENQEQLNAIHNLGLQMDRC